jgi:hypothetical protein
MLDMKLVTLTLKIDRKAQVIFWSMIVCELLIVCSIILAMRMI